MQIIDLTHTISPNTPVYPGTAPPDIHKVCFIEKDGFLEHRIAFHTHTGTHIDAPAHILQNGSTLQEFSIDTFFGKAIKINCQGLKTVTSEIIEQRMYIPRNIDFIIFETGRSDYWNKPEYFENFPVFEPNCAEVLQKFNIKAIGIDAISVDPVNTITYPAHKALFEKNILIIENLTNLKELPFREFTFGCMPLKTECPDGAPVRAFAILNNV